MLPKLTDAVKHLIIINVIIFFGQLLLKIDLTNTLAYHFPENENFKFWQYFTSMFMHGSVQHLLFNMIGLWMFGSVLEELLNTKRFLFLYISAGIGASLIKTALFYYQFNVNFNELLNLGLSSQDILNLMDRTKAYENAIIQKVNKIYSYPSLGASGAIFGIFAAYATYFPNQKSFIFPIPFPIKNVVLIVCLIVSDLILGTFSLPGDNVGRFAHVGGAIIGFIIAKYWKKNSYV